jgi:shikimate dehydrogenase
MVSSHLAVLGQPIAHSKSPDIHTAAYEFLGLDWDYGRYEIDAPSLSDFLSRRDANWRGLSLTMPLKRKAFELATAVDEYAAKTEAVNTLVKAGDNWIGYNTDVFGLRQAIGLGIDSVPETVTVLGSGATSGSALTAVSELFPDAALAICARNTEAAAEVAMRCAPLATVLTLHDLPVSDLYVSTLPTGVIDGLSLGSGSLFDVNYGHASGERNVLAPATEMLLWQAIAQIRIFVSGDPAATLSDEESLLSVMREAL